MMGTDDWRAETQTRLQKSALYAALRTKCQGDSAGASVLSLVDEATFYAFQKTKAILRHMGEFTLHDGDHLFRVLSLMEHLLTEAQVAELTTPELMLLILSAFFHDIGMAAEERDVQAWRKFWDEEPSFADSSEQSQFQQFERFCSARPEQLARITTLKSQGKLTEADTAKAYLITEYIRITHAERARETIKKDWLSKIRYRDLDLTVEFASICFSHNEDAASILELDRKCLCGPDTVACLPLVAGILRLADLLDFDAKRTPQVLFSHLFVRHPISLREWQKHRAVEAWSISSNAIQLHAKCNHPAIQASLHAFCDIIDIELSTCNNVFSALNEFHRSEGRNLVLRLPLKVDRSKIETKRTIDGKPEFLYRQTQFNLSKSQVIDLLMGTKLYGEPEVALRELLQNSIDACLLRQALETAWANPYSPEIHVRYFSRDGEDVLEIDDNGIGMDQHIIDSYYSKVGSSFYKSADFYDLRAETKAVFVPTSRFGIGILSCFMVADTLMVDTRKVYGPHQSSEPISLTIEGQESIFFIKAGARQTPGTTTTLVLRKATNPWDRMNEEDFIASVERVAPNPPIPISIHTESHAKVRTKSSFQELRPDSLKRHSWRKHKNVRQIDVTLDEPCSGLVGSAIVAVLQNHGKPSRNVEMTSKSVQIDDEDYALTKRLALSGKDISEQSTTITIDEDGLVESNDGFSIVYQSASQLSLHGIEVPTTLFPDSWSTDRNQAALKWPLPVLLVLDVCSPMDLDLNSSRTRVILSDKWVQFEEELSYQIFSRVAEAVGPDYWGKLRRLLLDTASNDVFVGGISRIETMPRARRRRGTPRSSTRKRISRLARP